MCAPYLALDHKTGVGGQVEMRPRPRWAASDSDSVKSEPESDAGGSVGELDDDEFEEVADRFESSYNFRFEEPCVPFIILVLTCLLLTLPHQRWRRDRATPS